MDYLETALWLLLVFGLAWGARALLARLRRNRHAPWQGGGTGGSPRQKPRRPERME